MSTTATKSCRTCRHCNESSQVLRLQWLDTYPEGSRWYDNHICLECGVCADGSGCSLSEDSLREHRRKYGYAVYRENTVFQKLLDVAVTEAEAGLAEGGVPIGAAIGDADGHILASAHNMRVQSGDPMAHAEIACMTALGRGRSFRGLILASTLMPCALCAGAAIQFGIGTVVAGERRNYEGEGLLMESRGMRVVDLNDSRCIQMMAAFVHDNPNLWDEDIGTV